MRFTIMDMETDGLLRDVTKIHCLCYQIYENREFISKGSITDPAQMKSFLETAENLVCHNGIRYDLRVAMKLLGISWRRILDTLGMSYYLYPNRKKHGLEVYGQELGVEKPKIEDWKGLTLEQYIHRCEEDVEINARLFIKLFSYLMDIYEDMDKVINVVYYLGFKLDCLADQEEVGITLNKKLVNKHIDDLTPMFEQKTKLLSSAMPVELAKVIKSRPKVMFKKDGSLSVHGENWIKYIADNNLPPETIDHKEECKPSSDTQLKKWLFMLGWKPQTFKISKATKEKIPQVSLPFGQGLCQSVKDLYGVEPILEELDGYFKLRHRIGVFKSFLKNEIDGKVYATAHGFTNTLRLTHSEPVVNLPKPGVFYGKEIREVLTIPNDSYIMCGSDVSGLEDNTKQHYIFNYDPDYVTQMRVPGFDPHIDIGVLAGLITKEEESLYKSIESMTEEEKSAVEDVIMKDYKGVKKKRGTSKVANFAMTYNAYPPKIAETAKITLKEAEVLFDTYWVRNWAIKKIADSCIVKTVNGQKWLYNPMSGYWLFLKADKDRFSTLNQNTGVFVFDSWLYKVRNRLKVYNIKVCMQYHDELLLYFNKDYKDIVKEILTTSMKEVNEELRLNIEIKVSVDIGGDYAECH